MRTRDKQIGELQGWDWLKLGAWLVPFLFMGILLGACGEDDTPENPIVYEGVWEQRTDPWTGEVIHCTTTNRNDGGLWCYRP